MTQRLQYSVEERKSGLSVAKKVVGFQPGEVVALSMPEEPDHSPGGDYSPENDDE